MALPKEIPDTRETVINPNPGASFPAYGGTDEDQLAEGAAREDARPLGHPILDKYVQNQDVLGQYAKQAGLDAAGATTVPSGPPPADETIARARAAGGGVAPGGVIDLPVIGGGWQRTISPEAQKGFAEGFSEQGQALSSGTHQIMEAERRAEGIRKAAADQTIDDLADQAGKAEGEMFFRKNEEKKLSQIKEDSDAEVKRALDEVKNTPAPDPNKYWDDKDDITKVSLAISTALGTLGQAYVGGPNTALDIINDSIKGSLKRQENELAKKKMDADNALSRNLRITGDLDKARELTRLQMIEVAKLMSQKRAMEAGSAMAQAQHEKLIAGLQAQGDQAQADLTMRQAELRARTETRVAPTVLGAGLLSRSEQDDPRYVPALGGLAPRPEDAAKLNDKAGALVGLQDNLLKAATIRREMSRMRSAAGSTTDLGKDEKYLRLESEFNTAVTQANAYLGQGAISGTDADRARSVVGDLMNPKLSGDDVANAAVSIANNFGAQFQQLRHTANITPVEVKQVRDPRTGRITRVFLPTGEIPARPELQQTTDAKLKPTVPQK